MHRIVLILLASSYSSYPQSADPNRAFEVVSIKRSTETLEALMRSGRTQVRVDDARAEYWIISLSTMIQLAYRLPPDQVSGPGWLQDDRWDIVAKLPSGATRKQVPEMVQAMLADRFRLKSHFEESVRPVYNLVLGRGPLKLRESSSTDTDPPGCLGLPHHVCKNYTMAQLASLLTQSARLNAMSGPGVMGWGLDRPVSDKTGLKGAYDFEMDYGRVTDNTSDTGMSALPISEAVKALGLALVSAKQPFPILVIDSIDRTPTKN